MRRLLSNSIVGTFLAGLFALLPIFLTLIILGWIAGYLKQLFGPGSFVAWALESVGSKVVPGSSLALVIGWVLLVVAIWLFGLAIRVLTRRRVEGFMRGWIDRIPFVKSVYSTAAQLVGMIHKDEDSEFDSMMAGFYSFSDEEGAGILGLIASSDLYCIEGKDYRIFYIPTSPLPATGGLIFVPASRCKEVDMTVEQVMRVYLSIGILAPQVMPPGCRKVAETPNAEKILPDENDSSGSDS
jgi:uncharacterized membrane protein